MKNAHSSKNLRTPRHPERGAAAVEFALVFPLFALLAFGIIDYGWFFYQRFTIGNAVLDGTRTGVTVSPTDTPDPSAKAIQVARANLQAAGIGSVTLTAAIAGSGSTKTLTLTGVIPYPGLTGFLPMPGQVKSTTTMMLEQP